MRATASGDASTGPGDDIRSRLRLALRGALKAKDKAAAAALRSALAAIGNAEAIPAEAIPAEAMPSPGNDQYVAGSAGGLGTGEARRRILTEEDIAEIVCAEVTERQTAADQYEASGHGDQARRLRHEAQVINSAARSTNSTTTPLTRRR